MNMVTHFSLTKQAEGNTHGEVKMNLSCQYKNNKHLRV